MKSYIVSTVLVVAALLSGCASENDKVVLDTVGPRIERSADAGADHGTLTVYSAYEVNADFNARDPYRPEYSDYTIYASNGDLLKKVHNNSGTILQEAVPVTLSPGKYTVVANANGYGLVTVPVLIKARENTVLHLEGDGSWTNASGLDQTNAVHLPDGETVGWRAGL